MAGFLGCFCSSKKRCGVHRGLSPGDTVSCVASVGLDGDGAHLLGPVGVECSPGKPGSFWANISGLFSVHVLGVGLGYEVKDSHGVRWWGHLQGLIVTPPPFLRKFHPCFRPGVPATGVSKVAPRPNPPGWRFSHFSVPWGPLSQQVQAGPEVMCILLVWDPLLCDTDRGHLLRDRGGCHLAAH